MNLSRCVPAILLLLLVPLLSACSDERASVEIEGSAHSLSLIRVTTFPWDRTAKYSIVAARMPDCMRRHPMSEAGLDAKVEVYSPGNNAWILKQDGRMYVVETRTCEGFATLDKAPEDGIGALLGDFEMRKATLVFVAAPKVVPPAAPPSLPTPANVAPPVAPPSS